MIFPYQEIYANILLYKSRAKFSGTLMKSITTEEEVAMNHTLNDDVNVELEYELIKMERKRNKLIFAAMIIGMALIAALAVLQSNIHQQNKNMKKQSQNWKQK